MTLPYNPIICAIDNQDVDKSRELITNIKDDIGLIKIGLEYFLANGASGVGALSDLEMSVFLDLKLYDIPNTVAKAIMSLAGIDISMFTVHSLGGKDMLQAAVRAAEDLGEITESKKPDVIGVTMLTSFNQDDLANIGIKDKLDDQVKRLANLALESGLDGVVCSAHEIEIIRKSCGDDLLLVVPGIRPESSAKGDQKRVMNPFEALSLGADYLVIGRPITNSQNPAESASDILLSLEPIA